MTLLRDEEIKSLLTATPPLVEGFEQSVLTTLSSPVRSAALDLKVGVIFLPGKKDDEAGGPNHPEKSVTISPGQIAIVRTKECVQMPPNISGVGFPVSSTISLAGLLTTNPGQVDPGYKGHLHLTVINMTNSPFPLKEGDRIM